MDENNRQITTIAFTLANLYSLHYVLLNDIATFLMQYNQHHYHHGQKKISLTGTIGKVNIQKSKNREKPNRRFQIRPGKINEWWKVIQRKAFIEKWPENFRMSYDTFIILCVEQLPHITLQETHLRKPISVEKQISIVLYYYLSDEGRIRKVVNSFWVGKNTVPLVAGIATKAISEYMPKKQIVCPNTESVLKKWFPIFKETHRFPQCIGVVDRTHIGIKKPKDVSGSDFVNRIDFIL